MPLIVTEEERVKLWDLMKVLTPVRSCAKHLAERKRDLLTADGIMLMMIDDLKRQHLSRESELAAVMAETMVVKYVRRRNTNVLQLMKHLADREDVY